MKYLIITLTFLTLYSCEIKRTKEKKNNRAFIIEKSDDNNWTTSGEIYCDSVNMKSERHAEYWIDGSKFNLMGQIIKIYSNE